ncbi:hypothetical protein Patl1_33398 [Pistacia atlantica]|uniref:Uncharacterized protein n=1 Tax=Pistacia atlantica TaxID=434234 RepID=A0ACC0ZVW2_9ROSI|nr:hypothetical protein Patl1_33398 [Pistacia atlantica]
MILKRQVSHEMSGMLKVAIPLASMECQHWIAALSDMPLVCAQRYYYFAGFCFIMQALEMQIPTAKLVKSSALDANVNFFS